MGTSSIRRNLEFARHLEPRQIFARAGLVIKRRSLMYLARYFPLITRSAPSCELQVSNAAPQPVFQPRTNLAAKTPERDFELNLVGTRRQYRVPFDWRPKALDFGTRLELLNLHYMEYIEGLDADDVVEIIQDWIARNPRYDAEYWMWNWNSYALSIRAVVWMQELARRPAFYHEAFLKRANSSIAAQMEFLSNNLETDIRGNHIIKNIKALVWAGRYFEGRRPREWAALGQQLLAEELDSQILEDGFHFERSPAYHFQVFADLLECYSVIEAGALKEKLEARLCAMCQVVADFTHPDGLVSQFGDGGLHMTYSPAECLIAFEHQIGSRVQAQSSFAYFDCGYFGYRAGDSLFIIDCGKIAPDQLVAHGHGDILSFEWSVGGRRIFVDAGVFEYNAGFQRQYSRSTAAHNTLNLDHEDQAEFWGAFRLGRRPRVQMITYESRESGIFVKGSHNGYRHLSGKPQHERTVTLDGKCLVIQDKVIGGKGQLASAHFLLHPECRAEQIGRDFVISVGEVKLLFKTESKVRIQAGWYCPDFGVRQETTQIVVEYGAAPTIGQVEIVMV